MEYNPEDKQPTFIELKQFLLSFNISPQATITFDKWSRFLESAATTYGKYVYSWMMDSFDPAGDCDEDGVATHFYFSDATWAAFETAWNGRG
jgi:hypothetical protein